MDRQSSCQILKIPFGATKKEIRKAYRRLAMKYHPDRNPGDPEAAGKFKKVQKAYETLSGGKRLKENRQNALIRRDEGSYQDLTDPFLGFYMAMKAHFLKDQEEQPSSKKKRSRS